MKDNYKLLGLAIACLVIALSCLSLVSADLRFWNGDDSTTAGQNSMGGQNFTAYNFTSNYTGTLSKVQAYFIAAATTTNHNRSVGIFTGANAPTTLVGGWSSVTILDKANGTYTNWSWSANNPTLISGTKYWIVFNLTTPGSFTGFLRFGETIGVPSVYSISTPDWGSWDAFGSNNIQSMNIKLWAGGVISLNEPEDNAYKVSQYINFSSSYFIPTIALKNATLYLWNSTRLISKTLNTTFSPAENVSSWNITGFNVGTNYWNVLWCGEDGVNTNCNFSSSNYTFTYGQKINSETWSNTTSVLVTENFALNFTYASSIVNSVSGNLVYNGTAYSGTYSTDGTNSYLSYSLLIPSVTSQQTKQFYWSINLGLTAGGTYQFNTTTHNQIINIFGLDNCTTYTQKILIANLTEQELRTPINGTIEAILNVYPYGSRSSLIATYNNSYNSSFAQICAQSGFFNSTNYSIDYQLRFYSPTLFTQYLYGQNISLSNSTAPIKVILYDLNQSLGTTYNIVFSDYALIPYVGAVVNIYRQYIPLNQYLLVEAPLTDFNGKVSVHLISGTQVYKIIMTKDNQIISVFDNVVANCGTTLCTINLNSYPTQGSITDIQTSNGLYYWYTNTTNNVQLNYKTVDGLASNIKWEVLLANAYENETICSNIVYSSSGTITCAIPTVYINSTLVSFLYNNGKEIDPTLFNFGPTTDSIFGGTRVLLSILLYCSIAFLFISTPIGLVIGSILGVGLAIALHLVGGGTATNSIAVMIYFVVAGGVIIWRISRIIGEQ